jgi:signal transduction histidine kinase
MPLGTRRAAGAHRDSSRPAPAAYAGEDRRRVGHGLALDSPIRLAVLAAAMGILVAGRVALPTSIGTNAAADVAALATAVELALGAAAAGLLWRWSGRAIAGAIAAALAVLALEATGLLTLALDRLPGATGALPSTASAVGAGAAVLVLLARRAGRAPVDVGYHPARDLVAALATGAVVALGGRVSGTGLLVAVAVMVVVVLRAPARRPLIALGAGALGPTVALAASSTVAPVPAVAGVAIVAAALPLAWALVEMASMAAGERGRALDTAARYRQLTTAASRDRDAIEERDHDVLSALVAVEGGLRALRSSGHPAAEPTILLLDALAIELSAARGLLAPAAPSPVAGDFDLRELLRAVAQGEAARGARIGLGLPAGELRACGSPERIFQVLRNLLDNARRHAPGAMVQVSAWRDGDRIRMRVRDDGPGIPPADRATVFERRGRATTAAPDGSGLGLFVARRLMDEQHGELVLEDAGPGASFVLTLPAATGLAEAA